MSILGDEVYLGDFTIAGGRSTGWLEVAGAAYEEARATSNFNSDKVAGDIAVRRVFDRIRDETGNEPEYFGLENPFALSAAELLVKSAATGLRANMVDIRHNEIAKMETQLWQLGQSQSESMEGVFSPELRGEMASYNLRRARNDYRAEAIGNANDMLSRASTFTQWTAPLSGGVGAAFTDPQQLALGFVGGGSASTVLKAGVQEALVSIGTEALLQPVIASNYKQAGFDYSTGDAVTNLAAAGLFGGVIGAGGKGFSNAVFGTDEFKAAKAKIDALPADHPLKQVQSGKRREIIAAADKLGDQIKDEGVQLARELERIAVRYDRDAIPETPEGRVSEAEHVDMLDETMQAAELPETLPPPRAPEPTRRADGPDLSDPEIEFRKGMTFELDGRPVRQQILNIANLQTDAIAMQYKSGGDVDGVTKRLNGVARWNPNMDGKFVVWEKIDGTQVVADGHQRSGLARRLVQSGAEKEIYGNANVFREADGWTAEAVRAQAAKKNIGELTGDVLDIAMVFRDSPHIIDDTLPLSDAKIRDARAIATLSDEAYGMVRNGLIDPIHAAVLARYAGDPATHAAIAEAMAEASPANKVEARILVGQVLEAGFRTTEQMTLFGLEQREMTILKPKMQLVTSVVKQLRDDKRVFGLLEREADRIEAAGNTLQRGENASKAKTAAQVEELLVRLATRRGAISSRLNEAAGRVVDGEMTRAAAAREVADEMRALIDEDGFQAILDAPDPGDQQVRRDVYEGAADEDLDTLAQQMEDEIEARDDLTGDLFGTVPDADGAPVKNWQAEAAEIDKKIDRFEGCVIRPAAGVQ